ncbi:hypothetical protein GCM10010922_18620 [Microbacterium sorbitolivorans]|nr:hypothetical protein GCM10010922_18620 [Microbacterium sorbitolivorans]
MGREGAQEIGAPDRPVVSARGRFERDRPRIIARGCAFRGRYLVEWDDLRRALETFLEPAPHTKE